MQIPDTDATQRESIAHDLEDVLWHALGMDEFSDEMILGWVAERSPMFMGTGYTVNACNLCSSNSYSTHGCGTCCR